MTRLSVSQRKQKNKTTLKKSGLSQSSHREQLVSPFSFTEEIVATTRSFKGKVERIVGLSDSDQVLFSLNRRSLWFQPVLFEIRVVNQAFEDTKREILYVEVNSGSIGELTPIKKSDAVEQNIETITSFLQSLVVEQRSLQWHVKKRNGSSVSPLTEVFDLVRVDI